MVVITINVPEGDLHFLDSLAKTTLFPSRSEAIRFCIRNTVPMLLEQIETIDVFTEEVMTLKAVEEFNKSQDKKILVPKDRMAREFTEYSVVRRLE